MATITVRARYPVAPHVVWEELRHVGRHVEWMTDAVSIEFVGAQREGVGTSFRCRTKVGPLVTTDLMTITEWVEGAVMGVEHRGLITGSGTFTLQRERGGTVITWRERLTFPWWALGALGAAVAKPVLGHLWTRNLRALGRLLGEHR